MDILQPSRYRKWFLLGLLVQIIAAWFSVGYHHPDEHFQVLEFCNYKLGHSSANDLQWEFFEKCRSALLPFFAYVLSKGFIYIHLFDPFIVAFLLRLSMGISTWLIAIQLIKLLSPEFTTQLGKDFFVLCSMFLWYIPYIGVRFSPENFAGLSFFLGLIILLKANEYSFKKEILSYLITGFLLGIAVFVRLQMAFAILGLGIWMIFIKKENWRTILLITSGALIAITLCLGIDYWFYGTFTLTAYNYYAVNIIHHIAAKWGVYPWWYYLPLFLQSAIIPISIAMLLLFFMGLFKKPVHLFSLICICFLVGHSLIGHKEMRFLFPVNMAFVFIFCIGLDAIISRYTIRPILIRTLKFLSVINISILLFKIFTPAQETFNYYRFIYNFSQKDTKLVSLTESPFCMGDMAVNYFKPQKLDIYILQDWESLIKALNEDKKRSIFLSKKLIPESIATRYHLQKIYCVFPDFVLKFNINNWEARSNIWAIYQVK